MTITVRGADVGPETDNLAVRAADMVLQATGRRFGVHLTLDKRIPVQAGLGGGSSDAAAALHLVNQLAGNAGAASRTAPVRRAPGERRALLPVQRGTAGARLGPWRADDAARAAARCAGPPAGAAGGDADRGGLRLDR